MVCGKFYDIIPLIQRPEREVALRATGFLVIKTIQPHIRLLDFLRAVVKRIEGVLLVVTVTFISGVSTVLLLRLMRFGVINQ